MGTAVERCARKIGAGAIGRLAAGAPLSMVMLAMEAAQGEPCDLLKLKRCAGDKVARPASGEQVDAEAGNSLSPTADIWPCRSPPGPPTARRNPKRPDRSWREPRSASASTRWPTDRGSTGHHAEASGGTTYLDPPGPSRTRTSTCTAPGLVSSLLAGRRQPGAALAGNLGKGPRLRQSVTSSACSGGDTDHKPRHDDANADRASSNADRPSQVAGPAAPVREMRSLSSKRPRHPRGAIAVNRGEGNASGSPVLAARQSMLVERPADTEG